VKQALTVPRVLDVTKVYHLVGWYVHYLGLSVGDVILPKDYVHHVLELRVVFYELLVDVL